MSEQLPMQIIVYICPNAKTCGSFYAAPDFNPLRARELSQPQAQRTEDGSRATYSRLDCPACRQRGIAIERRPYIVTSITSLEAAMHTVGAPPGVVHEALGRPLPKIYT